MPDMRGNVPQSESGSFRTYVQEVLTWFLPAPQGTPERYPTPSRDACPVPAKVGWKMFQTCGSAPLLESKRTVVSAPISRASVVSRRPILCAASDVRHPPTTRGLCTGAP